MSFFENDIDKTSKAITKILRQTQSKEIIWQIGPKDVQLGAEEYVIGNVYTCSVLDKGLILFKYKLKYWTDYDEFNWVDRLKLQFVDLFGNPEWEFPNSNAISDLYEAVLYQISNVDTFLDTWLDE
jgi:hypothetical protein